MEKFKYVVLKIAENANPEIKNMIEEQLTDFISDFRTPDHPPYAAMIHSAIEELNEKRGSSEESISEHIRRHNPDLPLAHNSLLKHHLDKLCDSEELVVTNKHLYLLPGTNPTLEAYIKNEKARRMRKKKEKRGRWRVGRKQKASHKHGEADGKVKGNIDDKNELDEMRVDNKVDKVGELNHVLEQNERENGMLEEQSQLHQELSHEICAPVDDGNQLQFSSPERPPGFEFVRLQPENKDLIEQEAEMVFTSERLSESETLHQAEKEHWDHQQQLKGKSKRLYQSSSDILMELLPSGNQPEQHDLSTPERLEGVKSNDVKLSPQKVQQYGRRKKLKFQTMEEEMQDVSAEPEQIGPRKQLDLSDVDKSPQPISTECLQQSENFEESQTPESIGKQAPEYKIEITLTSNDVEKDLNPHLIVEHHGKSVLQTPIKKMGTRKIGQVVRRCSPRLAKSNQTCPSSLDSFPSSQLQDHSCMQAEPQNGPLSLQVEGSPKLNVEIDCASLAQKLHQFHLQTDGIAQTTKQTPTISAELCSTQKMDKTTKVSHQRAKLRSRQKSSSSQNIQTGLQSSSLAPGRMEKVEQEPMYIGQQQLQVNMPNRTELQASTSTLDLSPLCQRQPQLYQGRGRSSKPLSSLHHQHGKSNLPPYSGRGRGLGRPPKMELEQRSVQTNSSNQNIEGPNELSQ